MYGGRAPKAELCNKVRTYVCVYVCVYVCMYVCVHVCMYLRSEDHLQSGIICGILQISVQYGLRVFLNRVTQQRVISDRVTSKYLSFSFLLQRYSYANFERIDMGFHKLWRAENTHNVKYNTSFDEPPIAVSKFLNLAVHWPSKVWPVGMIARKICSTIERNLWNSLCHWTFHSKKVVKSSFYDKRDLKISKSKKSEQYFGDKFEIFICLFDEHFARHFGKSLTRDVTSYRQADWTTDFLGDTFPPCTVLKVINSPGHL